MDCFCEDCAVTTSSYGDWILHLTTPGHQTISSAAHLTTKWTNHVHVQTCVVLASMFTSKDPVEIARKFSKFGFLRNFYIHPSRRFFVMKYDTKQTAETALTKYSLDTSWKLAARFLDDLDRDDWLALFPPPETKTLDTITTTTTTTDKTSTDLCYKRKNDNNIDLEPSDVKIPRRLLPKSAEAHVRKAPAQELLPNPMHQHQQEQQQQFGGIGPPPNSMMPPPDRNPMGEWNNLNIEGIPSFQQVKDQTTYLHHQEPPPPPPQYFNQSSPFPQHHLQEPPSFNNNIPPRPPPYDQLHAPSPNFAASGYEYDSFAYLQSPPPHLQQPLIPPNDGQVWRNPTNPALKPPPPLPYPPKLLPAPSPTATCDTCQEKILLSPTNYFGNVEILQKHKALCRVVRTKTLVQVKNSSKKTVKRIQQFTKPITLIENTAPAPVPDPIPSPELKQLEPPSSSSSSSSSTTTTTTTVVKTEVVEIKQEAGTESSSPPEPLHPSCDSPSQVKVEESDSTSNNNTDKSSDNSNSNNSDSSNKLKLSCPISVINNSNSSSSKIPLIQSQPSSSSIFSLPFGFVTCTEGVCDGTRKFNKEGYFQHYNSVHLGIVVRKDGTVIRKFR